MHMHKENEPLPLCLSICGFMGSWSSLYDGYAILYTKPSLNEKSVGVLPIQINERSMYTVNGLQNIHDSKGLFGTLYSH